MSKGYPQLNEQRKEVKVRDLMTQPRNKHNHHHPKQQIATKSANLVQQKSSISAKPVDEDLYKISPELLENSKRVSLFCLYKHFKQQIKLQHATKC